MARVGLSPNALTLIGFGIAVLAAIAAGAQAWLLAGILVIFGGVFDMFDGLVARATGKVSKAGAFMDSTFDRWGEAILYIGVVWGAMQYTNGPWQYGVRKSLFYYEPQLITNYYSSDVRYGGWTSWNKRAADRVQVIADIDSQAPISRDTLASLSLQGVTGLLYIDLLANADLKRKMESVPSEQYPVIDSVQSNFDLFLASLPDLVGRAAEVADRASRVLSNENIASFTSTMQSIEKSAATLPQTMRDAQEVVAQFRQTSADLRAAASGARTLIDTSGPDLAAASERIRKISENLAATTANLDKLMNEHREDLGLFLRDSLPEMERLVRDSRQAAQEFRELSRSLKADPSQLLYEPSYRGVEIPR